MIKKENGEEIDDVDNCISCATCGGVNCHGLSRGQFGISPQMRMTFHLQIPHLKIIPKEIIGEENKNYCRKLFRTLGKKNHC